MKKLCLTPVFSGLYLSQIRDKLYRLSDDEWEIVFDLAAEEIDIVERETSVGIAEADTQNLQFKVWLSRRSN